MFLFLVPIGEWLWSSFGKYIIMAGVAAAAIGAFALSMFEKGKHSAEASEAAAQARTIQTTKTADASVSHMTDAEVDAAIKRWEPKT